MDRTDPKLSRKPGFSRSQAVRAGGVAFCALLVAMSASIATGLHPATEPSRIDREAHHLLIAQEPGPADIDRVAALTRRSLQKRPLDGAAHLRAAYLSVLASGRLDPDANSAILRSYAVEPLGSELTLWRLGFVLDNWTGASPDVRKAALREMTAVYPRRSWDFDALARTAEDPQGRMVATITTKRLRRELNARLQTPPA